jgi:hypothetical protein
VEKMSAADKANMDEEAANFNIVILALLSWRLTQD